MAVTDRQREQQSEENPLLEGLRLRRTPEPCVLVIFGASGDLTRRKIFPALYSLAMRDLLPEQFGVVGIARTEHSTEEFVASMEEGIRRFARDEFRADVWERLAGVTRYVSMDFADERGEDLVAQTLNEFDRDVGTRGNRVCYLAVPPAAMPTVVQELGERRTTTGWMRLIVEKPFGHDRASARELNELLARHFTEDEVFR